MSRYSSSLPWLVGLLLQAALSVILVFKRIWRKFPLFLLYALSNFVLCLNAYAIFKSGPPFVYFITFWLKEGVSLLLGLAVLYEIFNHLLKPYPALRRLATQIFQTVGLLLVLLGCIVIYAQHMGEHNSFWVAFLVVTQATRIVEVGSLAFLFLFASAFGLHWRQYVFGIALGLGIFAAVELVAITMRAQMGTSASTIVNVVRGISFNSSLLIWIGYILAPELAASPAEVPKRTQLEQWNRAIMELIYQ